MPNKLAAASNGLYAAWPTSERLKRHGLFFIEDAQTMFLWVGRDAVPQLIMDVFNLPDYDVFFLRRKGKVTMFMSSRASTDIEGTDYATRAGQFILSTSKRHYPKGERDAAWGLLPASICCQRRRRTAT